ncbi:MAG: hypothetical protein RIQ56_587 [Candidatus Parcubacteria bacterium]|jgi:hypothetical protein
MTEPTGVKSSEKSFHEALNAEYPPEAIERWRAGGKRWREFERQLSMLGMYRDLTDSSRNALRSVFLGEKPAVFLESGDDMKRLRPIVEATGLAITKGRMQDIDYIYDPAQVDDVLRRNRESFDESASVTQVMNELVRARGDRSDRQRGLVLGFPSAAVEAYAIRQGIGILLGDRFYDALSADDRTTYEAMFATYDKTFTPAQKSDWLRAKLSEYATRAGIAREKLAEIDSQIDREASWQLFGAHGFIWADFAASNESVEKEKRIRDAFAVAGLN